MHNVTSLDKNALTWVQTLFGLDSSDVFGFKGQTHQHKVWQIYLKL